MSEKTSKSQLLKLSAAELVDIINNQQSELASQQSKLESQHHEIAGLRYQLNYYLSKKYGKSSDVVPSEQLSLFDEGEDEAVDETNSSNVDKTTKITIKEYTRVTSGSKPLSKDLPREQLIIDISEQEKICSCGCVLKRMGEEVSEKIDITPAVVRVLEVIRPKYVCKACEEGVSTAPMPKTAIQKGLPTPGTLSHVILSKYEDHLPLYRQEQIFQRMGIDIPRNTLCGWVLKCAELLTPMYEIMRDDLRQSAYMQVDETPVQVLKQPKETAKKHYMWCYLSRAPDNPITIYDYHASRAGYVVEDFLKDFKGLLQTDGYAGYNNVPCQTHGVCWTHARRKFVDIVKNTQKAGIARTVVDYIAKLYAIEKQARDKCLSHAERQQLRQENSPQILEEIYTYLQDKLPKTPPKSPIGRAIAYTLKLWDKLNVYVNNGAMEIDTNLVENTIRPFAVGRRNWLFKGNERGAKAGAILYSILLTCKANAIEPYAYLKYILYQIPKINSDSELIQLLPYNIQREKLSNAYNQIWY